MDAGVELARPEADSAVTKSELTPGRRIKASAETTTASGLPVRAIAERVGFFFEHRRNGPYGPGIWEVVLTLGTWSRSLTHSGSPTEVRATLKHLVKRLAKQEDQWKRRKP